MLVLSEGPSSPSNFVSQFCKVREVRGEGVRSARRGSRKSRGQEVREERCEECET